MEQLDQALSKLEDQLYAILEGSSDQKVRTLVADIRHLKGAKEVLRRQAAPAFVVDPNPKGVTTNGNGHSAVWTQGDAAVEILRKAGHPLHITAIMAEFPKYGIENAKKVNLASILIKDRRERFINKGHATFALNPHPRGDAEQKPRTQAGLPQGFSLMESVKGLLPELRHKGDFSMPLIYQILTDRNPPHVADRIQKASISTTLSVLKERGLIEVTHEGTGNDPRRYKVKD